MDAYFHNKYPNKLIVTNLINQNEKDKLVDFANKVDDHDLSASKIYDLDGDVSGVTFSIGRLHHHHSCDSDCNNGSANQGTEQENIINITRGHIVTVDFEVSSKQIINLDDIEIVFTIKDKRSNILIQKRLSSGDIIFKKDYFHLVLTHADTTSLVESNYFFNIVYSNNDYSDPILVGDVIVKDE